MNQTRHNIQGHCAERFDPVREAFLKNFTDDLELGASFALSIDGEMVVDLWGGHSDRKRTQPWLQDTIVSVNSSSKVIVSLCGLLAIDRGLIDLDEPIATYWPEFAAAGKDKITVRQIFCYTTGLPHLDGKPGWDVLDDWDEVIRRLSAQTPWIEPGTQNAYQPFLYGHMIGELIRRTTGKNLNQFFHDEVGETLGIDFSFGHNETLMPRMAQFYQTPVGPDVSEEDLDPLSVAYRAIGYTFMEDANHAYRAGKGGPTGLNIPAGNGVTNARALAMAGSVLAQGGTSKGRRFMSEQTAALASEEQSYTYDLLMEGPVRYGMGFAISSTELPFPWPGTFHWGGYGGSGVIMVPELGAAWAYTPNNFIAERGIMDQRGNALKEVVIACLQKA